MGELDNNIQENEVIIEPATHVEGWHNNTGWDPMFVEGVNFTDFSFVGDKGYQQALKTLTPLKTERSIKSAIKTNQLDLLNHLYSMIFINWNGAEIKNGNLENGNTKVISSTPEFLSIFQNLCIKVYNNLKKLKTIVKGDYRNNKNKSVEDVNDVVDVLSNLCSDFDTYVYKGKTKSGAIKNSYALTAPCGQNLISTTNSNSLMPFIKIENGETIIDIGDGDIYDVIFYNSSNDDTNKPSYTITIYNDAQIIDPQNFTIKVPDGDQIELECPYGGYCEINYLRIGNTIYVRAA